MIPNVRDLLVRNWWVFAVRGVVAIGFGVLAFARPDITLAALVALFGAFALADGVLMLFASPLLSGTPYFGWMLVDGLLGIAVGVLTFVHPAATAVSLLFLLGAWLIVAGLFRLGMAVALRGEIECGWGYVLGALFSVAAGVLTFCWPRSSMLAWIWVVGIYAFAYGVAMIAVSARLHQIGTHLPKPTAAS